MTYCEEFFFYLVSCNIRPTKCITFSIWNQVYIYCGMLTLNFVYLEYIKIIFYFSLKSFLKYTLILFFLFLLCLLFPTPSPKFLLFYTFRNIYFWIFTILFNIRNESFTFTYNCNPSAVQLSSVQLYYLQQVCVFLLFPYFMRKRQ